MAREQKRADYLLRIPTGLKRMLEEQAVQNNRSLNAEIVQRLQNSLTGWKR